MARPLNHLPNASSVLILGMLAFLLALPQLLAAYSLTMFLKFAILYLLPSMLGVALAVIAIVRARRGHRMLRRSPGAYAGAAALRLGRGLAIAGLVIFFLGWTNVLFYGGATLGKMLVDQF